LDHIRPRLAILTLISAGVAAGAAAIAATAQAPSGFPIRAAQWLDPAQRVSALSSQPLECTSVPREPGQRQLFEIGRAAFRAPLLLGGQAARAGLSCSSCHSNGRRNQAFRFPGLSGDPGTADVTSSLMSTHRGNGLFDPKPIPDLALPGRISRRSDDPALDNFIRGLIVEEFDGAEPPPLILRGLGTYVRAIGGREISQTDCDLASREALRLDSLVLDVSRALKASRYAWVTGDAASARLLLSGARSGLGLINERYAAPNLRRDQQVLRIADHDLLATELQMDSGRGDVLARISASQKSILRWSVVLKHDQGRSLFEPSRLRESMRP
jgi:hypothetical protein